MCVFCESGAVFECDIYIYAHPQIVYSLAHSMKGWWCGAYGCYSISGYHKREHHTNTTLYGDGMATSSEDYKERVLGGGGEEKGYATQTEKILFQV